MQDAADTSQWDFVPVRVIHDLHRLTGVCTQIEDGLVKRFFNEEVKEDAESKNTRSTDS